VNAASTSFCFVAAKQAAREPGSLADMLAPLRYGVATAMPNFSRVMVQGSTTAPLTEWLRLKVDASSASVFSWERNPR